MPVWTVFDLDNTLILNTPVAATPNTPGGEEELRLSLYNDTVRVLRFLVDRGVIITLASFRTNAEEVLRQYGLRNYFAAVRYTRDRENDHRTKSQMIGELAHELGLSPYEAVFYDDLPENVIECNDRLIYTIQVDPTQGVTMELLFDTLFSALRPPLYVLSEQSLPQKEIKEYLAEYRTSFLSYQPQSSIALQITDSQPEATVMVLVSGTNTIELYHDDLVVRVTYPDLYECVDAALHSLQEQGKDVPHSLGELLRQ